MIDKYTLEECQKDPKVLDIKISTLEHAIKQSEAMLNESQMEQESLVFLRRKIASSIQDLETLYLIKRNLTD